MTDKTGKYKCNLCKSSYSQRGRLKEHMWIKHDVVLKNLRRGRHLKMKERK